MLWCVADAYRTRYVVVQHSIAIKYWKIMVQPVSDMHRGIKVLFRDICRFFLSVAGNGTLIALFIIIPVNNKEDAVVFWGLWRRGSCFAPSSSPTPSFWWTIELMYYHKKKSLFSPKCQLSSGLRYAVIRHEPFDTMAVRVQWDVQWALEALSIRNRLCPEMGSFGNLLVASKNVL